MIPQLLMLRPRGSPVAENRRVQPDRPSVACTWNRTGVATEPRWLLTAAMLAVEWTYQLKLCVACSAPSVAVTDTGNEAADPGSVPLMAPVEGSIGVLVGSGVVSCGEQRSELRFELSQRDVRRAVSFLMSGACREHKSDAYQITSWCKRQ